MEQAFIKEALLLIIGALLGWLPNRKKQKVDTKMIEVTVLEKALQVIQKDVFEPFSERFVQLQEDYTQVTTQLKQLQNAVEKIHLCHYVSACPVKLELQKSPTVKGRKRKNTKPTTNGQHQPGSEGSDEAGNDSNGIGPDESIS